MDERTYKFTHPKDPSVLTVDIISDKLQFRYDWVTNQELYTKPLTLPREQVVSEAKALQSLNLLPADIAESQIKITYLTATPPTLTPAISASEANFARATFYRSDKDGLKFCRLLVSNPARSVSFWVLKLFWPTTIIQNY